MDMSTMTENVGVYADYFVQRRRPDSFETSKLYATAPTLGRRPLSQHQRAV
jgi:hypothetical protein